MNVNARKKVLANRAEKALETMHKSAIWYGQAGVGTKQESMMKERAERNRAILAETIRELSAL